MQRHASPAAKAPARKAPEAPAAPDRRSPARSSLPFQFALGGVQVSPADAPSSPAPASEAPAFRAPPSARLAMSRSRSAMTLGPARLHVDAPAASAAEGLGAAAVTVGRDVYFGSGRFAPETAVGDRLLRHELVHVDQERNAPAFAPGRELPVAREDHPAERDAEAGRAGRRMGPELMAFRAVAKTPVARLDRDHVFGRAAPPPLPGLSLEEFKDYTRKQADWFREPTLAAADRDRLWALLLLNEKDKHFFSGARDLKVKDLVGMAPADAAKLQAFCRAADPSGDTIRIHGVTTYTFADRKAYGATLLDFETVLPAAALRLTVSESQIKKVHTSAWMPSIKAYWAAFEPHLQATFGYDPTVPGGEGPEFKKLLGLFAAIGPAVAPIKPLAGTGPADRWVRNPHRFGVATLGKLVSNLSDKSGIRKLVLVLHTSHDPESFQVASGLFDSLIIGSSGFNNVLMIEGPRSLADVTARIPLITATWGQKVSKGALWWKTTRRRLSQVIIAGHGESRLVELAGSGPASVPAGGKAVGYGPIESLDLDANLKATKDLFDALSKNMDPATARLVFAGCLVGSTKVPPGTAAAAMPAAFAKDTLAEFAEKQGVAAGLPAGFVQAARADVALGDVTDLFDPFTGNVRVTYPKDPTAFGSTAKTYAEKGREPTGVLRAAVEVGTKVGKVAAETSLRARLALPPVPTDWYDQVTRAWVRVVLAGVPLGAGIDLQKANDLASAGSKFFLARWPDNFRITVASLTPMNAQPFAAQVYAEIAATPDFTAMGDNPRKRMRLLVEQSWLALAGAPRLAAFQAAILATGLRAEAFQNYLDLGVLGPHAAALLPVGGVPPVERIRLAVAWFERDPTNAQARAFLTAQVPTGTGAKAAFTPAVHAEVPAGSDDRILEDLGLLTATAPPAAPGLAPRPLANVQVPGDPMNTVRVEARIYEAKVLTPPGVALNVHRGPGKGFAVFAGVKSGDTVRVQGFTGHWAAIELGGKLGFVHRGTDAKPFIEKPPP